MSHRTVVASSFEEYLANDGGSLQAEEDVDRNKRLSCFPYSVMLQVSFAELNFANRWCWQNLGPSDGECLDRHSEYRVCACDEPHSHSGKWTWYFFEKTEYNFGFCEWYFAESKDHERFLANVDKINWGEHYPK